MKKILLFFTLVLFVHSFIFSQSDKEIAKVYMKRAKVSAEGLRYDESIENFEKSLEVKDSITNTNDAYLGMLIYFETKDYEKSFKYTKQYFVLAKNKKTEEYMEMLELHVDIKEKLEEIALIKKQEEIARLRKERELAIIDSLKTIWQNNANLLSIKADSIYAFNKNSLALYESDGSFGILNDTGNIIVKASEFKAAFAFEGFIVLSNNKENPTKIFSYNTITNESFTLPKVSEFNPMSTNYGKIMLPRSNGRLVTYPNNSLKTLVYDLNEKKFVRVANLKDLLKNLRKTDKIEKYNNDRQVRLDKEYYNFGGHIGEGIYPLYMDDFSLYGYLFSENGKVLHVSEYGFLGAFDGRNVQAKDNEKTIWLNQNGEKVSAPKDKFSQYDGLSTVSRIENGNYQIKQNGVIILGDKSLESMADYIRNNSPD